MKLSVKRFLCAVLIPCLMILCLLPPSSSQAASRYRYVYTENGKCLNVRDLPGKKGSVIARLANGSKVTVLEDEGDWIGIDLDDRTGYVMAQFLTESQPKSPDIEWEKTSKTMYVETGNKGRLHLRKDASRKSSSLGLFANGTKVQVSALSSSWAKVTVSGQSGYMMLSCLSEKKQTTAETVLERYVNENVTAKMYAEAGTNSDLLMKLPGGTLVKVYSESGKWSRVTAHGQVGYVLTSSLTNGAPRVSMKKATVINPNGASYVNLRSVPRMNGLENVLAHIKVDTTVEVLGRKRSWIKIGCYGMVGYVHKTFLSMD